MSELRDFPFDVSFFEEAEGYEPSEGQGIAPTKAFAAGGFRSAASAPPGEAVHGAVTARLHGFGLDEQPLVTGLPGLEREIVPARTTVRLLRANLGSTAVVLCERGDPRRPIIVGLLQDESSQDAHADGTADGAPPLVTVERDGDRVVLSAEREIVLRCGEASITLTRAGKVLIKGKYVLSRSSGYNKIKGAAVDIN